MPIVDHRTSLYDGQLEFADANIAGLITGGIRAATAKDVSGKKPCRVFEKAPPDEGQGRGCKLSTALNTEAKKTAGNHLKDSKFNFFSNFRYCKLFYFVI